MFSLNSVDGLRNRCLASLVGTILFIFTVVISVKLFFDGQPAALIAYNFTWVTAYFFSVVAVLGKFPIIYFRKLFMLLVSSVMNYCMLVYVQLIGKENESLFKNFGDIYETLGEEGRSNVKAFLLYQTQIMAESQRYLVVLLVCVAYVSLVFLFSAYGTLMCDVRVRWQALNKSHFVEGE